tara:strand:+ start:2576 stop:2863 length:288 start_codon:yes stop_codon:yes gene_type:complete
MFKTPQEMADFIKSFQPSVKANKSGYEIRTKVLDMAKDQTWSSYGFKFGAWESSSKKEGDEVVTKVTMPEIPTAEDVLKTAETFYNFVSGKDNKK